jgi:predicted esterase
MADGVVAAVRAIPELSSKWMVVGQSQGGNAALHTLAAQSRQPSLDFRGAVTTGAVVVAEQLFPASDGRHPQTDRGITPLELYLLAGLKVVRPDIEVDSYLTDEGRTLVDQASESCYPELDRATQGLHISQLLTRDPKPLRAAIAQYADVPVTGFRQPVFIAHGTRDNVVGVSRSDAFVRSLATGGEPVLYRTYPTDHWATMRASRVDSAPFVHQQFGR